MGTVENGLRSAGPLLGTGLAMQQAGRQRERAPKPEDPNKPSNAATKQCFMASSISRDLTDLER